MDFGRGVAEGFLVVKVVVVGGKNTGVK